MYKTALIVFHFSIHRTERPDSFGFNSWERIGYKDLQYSLGELPCLLKTAVVPTPYFNALLKERSALFNFEIFCEISYLSLPSIPFHLLVDYTRIVDNE